MWCIAENLQRWGLSTAFTKVGAEHVTSCDWLFCKPTHHALRGNTCWTLLPQDIYIWSPGSCCLSKIHLTLPNCPDCMQPQHVRTWNWGNCALSDSGYGLMTLFTWSSCWFFWNHALTSIWMRCKLSFNSSMVLLLGDQLYGIHWLSLALQRKRFVVLLIEYI